MGRPELGDAIAKAGEAYAKEHLGAPREEPKASDSSTPSADADEGFIDNVQGRKETLQKNINKQVNSVAARRLMQVYGRQFSKDLQGPEIQKTWTWVYEKAGIPWRPGVRSGDRLKTLNEDQLRRLWQVLSEEA